MNQQEAVNIALGDCTGSVHIWGAPEMRRGISWRLCSEGDVGERVVAHEHFVEMAGFFVCQNCGITNGPEA